MEGFGCCDWTTEVSLVICNSQTNTDVEVVFVTFHSAGNPGSVIVPQYCSSKITVFVWGKIRS